MTTTKAKGPRVTLGPKTDRGPGWARTADVDGQRFVIACRPAGPVRKRYGQRGRTWQLSVLDAQSGSWILVVAGSKSTSCRKLLEWAGVLPSRRWETIKSCDGWAERDRALQLTAEERADGRWQLTGWPHGGPTVHGVASGTVGASAIGDRLPRLNLQAARTAVAAEAPHLDALTVIWQPCTVTGARAVHAMLQRR